MHWFLLLFIVVPLVELTLLLVLGDLTHWWVSVLTVVLSGVVGTVLARRQGVKVFGEIREQMQRGEMPTRSVVDAGLIFLAGAFLLTPGILTDLVGLSMLIPFCRGFYRRRLLAWFRRRFHIAPLADSAASSRTVVIDSYVVDHQEGDRDEDEVN